MNIWHIWEEPFPKSLEQLVKTLAIDPNNSLLICSAEESYSDPLELIEKIHPADDGDWVNDFGNIEQFKQNLTKLKNVDIILGTPDNKIIENYKQLGTVHSWPDYFLFRSYANLSANFQPNDIEKIFICLNTKAHYHRCMMIDRLHQKKLLEKGYFSWHDMPSYTSKTQYIWKSWDPKKVTLSDDYNVYDGNHLKSQHTIPDESNKSFMFLVNETCTDRIFVTEKTWHPILIGKPFLSFASPNFHKYLQQLGFVLYDEIFNYDFDNILNDYERCKQIVLEVENISNLDLNQLNNTIQEKIIYNQNHAIELLKTQKNVPNVAKKFNVYNKLLLDVMGKIRNE